MPRRKRNRSQTATTGNESTPSRDEERDSVDTGNEGTPSRDEERDSMDTGNEGTSSRDEERDSMTGNEGTSSRDEESDSMTGNEGTSSRDEESDSMTGNEGTPSRDEESDSMTGNEGTLSRDEESDSMTGNEGTLSRDEERDSMDTEDFFPTQQDVNLPRIAVQRLAKSAIPANTYIHEDAVTAMTKSATIFVNYLANAANDSPAMGTRKTISQEAVLDALSELGFEELIPRVRAEVLHFNEVQSEKRNEYQRKLKEKQEKLKEKEGN